MKACPDGTGRQNADSVHSNSVTSGLSFDLKDKIVGTKRFNLAQPGLGLVSINQWFILFSAQVMD